MAITNNLKIFANNTEVTNYTDSGATIAGFQPGTVITALSVNTALRNATLLPYTFIDILKNNTSASGAGDLTIETTTEYTDAFRTSVATAINAYINNKISIGIKDADGKMFNSTYDTTNKKQVIELKGILSNKLSLGNIEASTIDASTINVSTININSTINLGLSGNITSSKYSSLNNSSSFNIYGNGIKYYQTSPGGSISSPVDICPVSKRKFATYATYNTVKDIITSDKLINIIYDDGTDKSSCIWYISNGTIYINRNDKTGSEVTISSGGTGGINIANYYYIIYEY